MNNEYTVKKKSEGKYKLSRIMMIAFYFLFVLAFFVAAYKSGFIQTFAMAPIFLWILIYFTWRYVSIEYKYTVEAGMLTTYIVYGEKKKKKTASYHIKEASAFLPLSEAGDAIKSFVPKKTVSMLVSKKKPMEPYAFMIEAGGERVLLLLEAPENPRKAIRYYLSDAVKNP